MALSVIGTHALVLTTLISSLGHYDGDIAQRKMVNEWRSEYGKSINNLQTILNATPHHPSYNSSLPAGMASGGDSETLLAQPFTTVQQNQNVIPMVRQMNNGQSLMR